jgi:hypothetical protein
MTKVLIRSVLPVLLIVTLGVWAWGNRTERYQEARIGQPSPSNFQNQLHVFGVTEDFVKHAAQMGYDYVFRLLHTDVPP